MKNALSKKEVDALRGQLIAMRHHLNPQALQDELGSASQAAHTGADIVDSASLNEASAVLETLSHNNTLSLRNINDALERIAEGTYGECVECLQPISKARLEFNPATPHCIKCQRRLEQAQGTARHDMGRVFREED